MNKFEEMMAEYESALMNLNNLKRELDGSSPAIMDMLYRIEQSVEALMDAASGTKLMGGK